MHCDGVHLYPSCPEAEAAELPEPGSLRIGEAIYKRPPVSVSVSTQSSLPRPMRLDGSAR